MKRRDFLRSVVPVTALPFLINGLPLRAYGRSPFLEALVGAQADTDRVLVLVQLGGGNDGINTVIPIDQLSAYNNARGNITIPDTSILPLTTATGLHPKMTGMKQLYDDAKLTIVQGVSYPNPNLSHFRATDIWLTAANSNEYLSTGWGGRYLEAEFSGYPDGYPNQVMPDPLAIQIGAVTTLVLQGPGSSMGISIQDPNTFYQLVNGVPTGGIDSPPQTPAGRELTFVRQVAVQSQQYATQVKAAADKVTQQVTYPTTNPLADQLKIVARLIAGGLKTRIYVVNMGGFDNHSSQVNSTDKTSGTHATLLQRLSDAMLAFQNDLKFLSTTANRLEDRVIGMTFSEFGRRVNSNASLGTDHGTAAPMFIFGKSVNGVPNGIIGTNPSLTDLTGGNLKMQYDFRSVYASILSQWFGVSSAELNSVMLRSFAQLPIIKPGVAVSVGDEQTVPAEYTLYANYPNPFNPSTTISYDLPSDANVVLKVYDMLGREVTTLIDERQSSGHHRVQFNASSGLSSGAYIYQLQAGSFRDRKRMMLIK
ncbi:MAG: DUF1501 domain-containing protein [Ignavibacteriales bacterium]|nr:DUF1501 domain-containing protein [Ignavibacteriales bacterium]